MTIVRVLLVAQGIGGLLAWVGLSVFLLIVVAFGAFAVALGVLAAWIAVMAVVIVILFGQNQIGRGDRRWLVTMAVVEVLVVLAGVAVEAYLLGFANPAVPRAPMRNILLASLLPILALVNLAFIAGLWRNLVSRSGSGRTSSPSRQSSRR